MMFSLGLGILPVTWSVFTISGPFVGYAVSVINYHIYPFLPSISDTGSRPPEANLFSMLMNLSIFFGLLNIYVRYYQCNLQIKYCREIKDTLIRLNRTGIVFAGFSIFGAIIVSNFQSREDRILVVIHDSGAVLMFTFGGFYFWIHTIIGYLMRPYGLYPGCICNLRLAFTTTITLCSITFFTASAYGYEKFVTSNHNHKISEWRSGDGGYLLHVFGNAAEWLALLAFISMSLSFYGEFQGVTISVVCKEKQPHIISTYDELSEYATLESISDEENAQ